MSTKPLSATKLEDALAGVLKEGMLIADDGSHQSSPSSARITRVPSQRNITPPQ